MSRIHCYRSNNISATTSTKQRYYIKGMVAVRYRARQTRCDWILISYNYDIKHSSYQENVALTAKWPVTKQYIMAATLTFLQFGLIS